MVSAPHRRLLGVVVSPGRDAARMRPLDLKILQLAEEQHGLAARDQLLRAGSTTALTRRVKSGLLVRRYESIYRVSGFAPTFKQELLAACLAGGRMNAAASFRAAAQILFLPGGEV